MSEPESAKLPNTRADEMFQLSAQDFDQGPNGWRSLIGTIPDEQVAEVILKYIAVHKAALEQPQGNYFPRIHILNFHAAQCYLIAGEQHYDKAFPLLEQSKKTDAYSVPWNAYVEATIGFITKDAEKIRTALAVAESPEHADNKSGNAPFIRALLNALESGRHDYKSAYQPE
jgi:hypothetical protein